MRQVNLLPSELKPSKQVGLQIRKAEKLFISLLILYLIMLGTSFISKNFLATKLKEAMDRKSILSNELKSLVNIETSTVYIRDRIEKYNTLSDKNIELTNLKLFEDSYSYFPLDAQTESINILENNISYNISVTNISSFSHLINGLKGSGIYKEILLSGLTYRIDKGYSFSLVMSF